MAYRKIATFLSEAGFDQLTTNAVGAAYSKFIEHNGQSLICIATIKPGIINCATLQYQGHDAKYKLHINFVNANEDALEQAIKELNRKTFKK